MILKFLIGAKKRHRCLICYRQKIEDEELRSVLVNRISLVKFIYEMNWIDRMKATVENFFKIENNDDNQKNGFYKDAEKVISENPRNSNKP
uniref:Uncharacterized protein n=1 Tax=Parastrongyloides trichosuri TaxID=131310 RepID=A0A0N4Z5X5_PARTI